ncbi:hypothetical protein Nmel_002989 [Mimus melanotis]
MSQLLFPMCLCLGDGSLGPVHTN